MILRSSGTSESLSDVSTLTQLVSRKPSALIPSFTVFLLSSQMTGSYTRARVPPAPPSLMVAPPGNCFLSGAKICRAFPSVYPEAQRKQKQQAEWAPGLLNPFHVDFLGIWKRGGGDLGGSASSLLRLTCLQKANVCLFFLGEKGGKCKVAFLYPQPYPVIYQFSHTNIQRTNHQRWLCEPSL